MSESGTHVLAATVALLALVSPVAHGLDSSKATHYASVDPTAFRQSALPANPTAPVAANKARVQKKPKAVKTRMLTGLNNFSSPARRALDRIKHVERNCGVGATACPPTHRSGLDQSQSWSHATLRRPPSEAAEGSSTDSNPALVRPYTEVPGLVPGRESSYKLSLNMPLGRYENVLLQANVRKNAFNMQNSSDSTLRADWSLRF